MNRRGFITIAAGVAASIAAPFRAKAQTAESIGKITYISIGGDVCDEPPARKIFLDSGVEIDPSFALMRGPIDEVYWPVIHEGKWESDCHAYLTCPADTGFIWMFPVRVKARDTRKNPYVLHEGVVRGVASFDTKLGWHRIAIDGGSLPTV